MNRIIPTHLCCSSLLLASSLTLLSGCGRGAAASHSEAPSDVDQVVLSISAVPADVSCVRITAAGASRQVVREIDVVPGGSLTESFSGLPTGSVVFRGEAFESGCDSVTKSTVPDWISQDETVNVTLTKTASVTLSLARNGRAKVTVDFDQEVDAGRIRD